MPIVEKGKSLLPPFASDLISQFGTLAVPWEEFFREVFVCLNPLGKEQSFQIGRAHV